jgi:hypothetical protein
MITLRNTKNRALEQKPDRRSFLARLVAGVLGGWAVFNIKPSLTKPRAERKHREESFRIHINPLAVPRTQKSAKPNGK